MATHGGGLSKSDEDNGRATACQPGSGARVLAASTSMSGRSSPTTQPSASRILWGSGTSPGWLTSPSLVAVCMVGETTFAREVCGMLSTRVGPIAISRVRASRELAGAAWALVGGEGRRDPGVAPRGRRASPHPPSAATGLGGPGGVRRADPAAARRAAPGSARHAGHGTALASAAGAVEVAADPGLDRASGTGPVRTDRL